MTEVIASPSVRNLAGNMGIDLVALATRLGRTHLTREDVVGTAAPLTASQPATPTVDHAAYGPIREEPLSRFAKIAAANLIAGSKPCAPACAAMVAA
jgi:pyruvate/2-oxoglutarate dehydrogenase complex dihydrolipoamide acyltransferase (E2) component